MLSSQVKAGDAPTIGLLYHTSEWSRLSYQCELESDDQLLCEMSWSDVRKLSAGKTLKEEIAAAISSLKSIDPRKPGRCDTTERRLAEVRNPSRASADLAKEIRALDEGDRRELVRSWALAAEFCRHPNRRLIKRMATLKFEQETRTCSIHSRHALRRFWKLNETTWASADGPNGLCGALWTARFERDPTVPEIWDYVDRFSIGNPDAAKPGLKCSDLKPYEHRYEWGAFDVATGCDYIRFGF
ncbi:hypothetical protein NML43_25470 [Rhodopseudomonas palustris]|uniref:hypothetical protein n=1 Tax=Rhodopseudomonas palustris TaxID=1076 RepID=UPI0020CBF98E|nr:hypothetical protein [Rhodopseudomonas palustris]MCP9630455.1 hypothetical protein [Rhodopseudomonas palustris]